MNCPAGPADASLDKDAWITVDIPVLERGNARAAIIFGHAFAEQDHIAERNGITVHVSRDGTSGLSPHNQLAQSKVNLANQAGDEHATTIIDLDENKDFKVLYHFGEMFSSSDETGLCWWGARIQLLGWIVGWGAMIAFKINKMARHTKWPCSPMATAHL